MADRARLRLLMSAKLLFERASRRRGVVAPGTPVSGRSTKPTVHIKFDGGKAIV